VTDDERRSRLAVRHFLAARGSGPKVEEVAGGLVGLHASDPATVFLSAAARAPELQVADLERELYERRTLLRMLAMRRTMFVVPLELVPVLQAACTDAVAAQQRKRLVADLEQAGVENAAAWLEPVLADTVAALHARGSATGAQLSADVPALRLQLSYGEGKRWGRTTGITTRVLTVLGAEGSIVRGRPRGTLVSSQYEWVPAADWLVQPLASWAPDEARVELVRRWLGSFGPATVQDVKWWTGWPLGLTRSALARLETVEVTLEGGEVALVLADDAEPVAACDPWIALLPGLDPTPMGWAGRDWYLGEHRIRLFDSNGNIAPTVWCNGRVVGGWAHLRTGEIAVKLLEDVGSEAETSIGAEAARLSAWLGDVRVTPRFRTPLELELTA
jgi:hypothetical protein